jgi:DNA-binding beta-propeller fold protein YncE
VADDEANVVRSYDSSTLEEEGRPVRVAANPVALEFSRSSGEIWVGHASGVVTRIAAGTGEAERVIVPDAGSIVGLAAATGSIWLADSERDAVIRLDAASGEVDSRVDIPAGVVRVAENQGSVWVTGKEDSVTPVFALGVGKPVKVGPGPIGLAVTRDDVWVSVSERDAVVRIDAESRKAIGEPIKTGKAPIDVAAGNGSVVVANQDDRNIVVLDASTGRRSKPLELGTRPRDVAVGAGRAWVVGVDPPLLVGHTL